MYSELLPLEVPYRSWTSISMDFIVGLSEFNGKTKIWVIVDRFSKISHLIALPKVNKTEDLAKIFLPKVWKHHGLPYDIVSDRDRMCISHFWQSLMDLLSIRLNLLTALHFETDDSTE
jgi:hypothetical protein